MAINNLNLRFSADVEEAIASGDIEAVPVLLDDWRKRIGQALNGLSDSIGDASLIITDRGKTLNSALDDVVNLKYPESYPAVPVTLRGDFTDDFDTDDGLTGPHQIAYYHTITGDLHVCDGYLYQYVASMRNGSAIATCLEKNPFLDYTEDFALETCIVDLKPDYDTTYRTHCMLGATDGDATTYQGWPMITGLGSGNSVDFRVVRATSGTELTLIGETDGNVEDQVSDTVTATLSRSDPLYLRIEFESDTDVLTFKYKGAGTGSSWITLGTIDATGHFTGDLSVAVLIMGGSTTKTTHWAMYDYLTVEYTPENTGDTYAFITAAAFGSYKKNHIYVRKTDGTFFDINPADIGNGKTADWLTVAAMGKLWRWDNDNSQWVVFRQPPTPHASRHYDGADDELAVDELPEARSPGNDVSNVLKPDGSGGVEFEDVDIEETVTSADAGKVAQAQADGSVSMEKVELDANTDVSSGITAGNVIEAGASGEAADSGIDFPIQLDETAEVGSSITEGNLIEAGASGEAADSGYSPSDFVTEGTRPPTVYGAEAYAFFVHCCGEM